MQHLDFRALVEIFDLLLVDAIWASDQDPETQGATLWAASAATGGIGALVLREGRIADLGERSWIETPDAPFRFAGATLFETDGQTQALVSGGRSGGLLVLGSSDSGVMTPQWTAQNTQGQPLNLSQLVTFETGQAPFWSARQPWVAQG